MKQKTMVCFIILIVTISHFSTNAISEINYTVTDPNASYFDVSDRYNILNSRSDLLNYSTYSESNFDSCEIPTPVDYFLVMPAFYDDKDGWEKAYEPLEKFETYITDTSELYVKTKNDKYAHCVADVLYEWAKKDSLMSFDYDGNDHQAWFGIEWTTSSAGMAYSIIKSNNSIESNKKTVIENWLKKVAKNQISYTGGSTSCCNNHSYWRGLEAIIVGVVSNDNELFRYGIERYKSALESMNSDGSLPLEMGRGSGAIHYQNFAILPLIYIAETAYRQGFNIYDLSIDGKSLHLAINFLMQCIENEDVVKNYTTEEQDMSFIDKKTELNWMEPYIRRYKNEKIETFIENRRPICHIWSGGNSTLYFFYTDNDTTENTENSDTGEYTQADLDAAEQKGRQACIDDPASCGISVGVDCPTPPIQDCTATFDMTTNTLHIPNFQDTYWLDFGLISWETVQFELKDVGEIE